MTEQITTLHLGLSYACNLKCKHCYVDKKKDALEFENIKQILDSLEQLQVLIYTYGEPLLSKNLYEVVDYARQKSLMQILLTNGWYITDDALIKLKKYGLNAINISIDSAKKENHDINRGVEGAFEKAILAIKKCKEHGFRTGIGCTVTDKNVYELDEILKLAKELNVDQISFLRQRTGKAVKLPQNYVDFARNIIKSNNNIRIYFHDPELLPIIKKLYENGNIDINKYELYSSMNMCHMPFSLSIAPNGDAFRCNLGNCPIGNVINNNIKELIEKKYEHFICNPKLS